MGKILNLKRWLTLSEAATYLSAAFKEEVTVADVLFLSLDGRLTISIDIMNGATGLAGKIVPATDAPTFTSPFSGDEIINGLSLSDGTVMVLENEVIHLRGIFDVPMIGGERHDIQRLYQERIGGPDVELISIDGSFVQGKDGQYFQLQESYDANEYTRGSAARGDILKAQIALGAIPADQAAKVMDEHEAERKEFLEQRRSNKKSDNYYPASGLPEGAALVVRADALRAFLSTLDEDSDAKELSTTERTTLLKLVIGMAISGYKYDPKASKSPAVKDIVTDLAIHGLSVTDDTVRKYLKEASQNILSKK